MTGSPFDPWRIGVYRHPCQQDAHQEDTMSDRHMHAGSCVVAVGLDAFGGHTGRELLEAVVNWTDGLEEFDADTALVRSVLDAQPIPNPAAASVVLVNADARQRIADVLEEAVGYWQMCDYAHDENPDVAWLGLVAADGNGLLACQLWSR
jgi:hypothetical protein